MTPDRSGGDAFGLPPKGLRADVAGMPFDLVTESLVDDAIRNRPPEATFEYVVTPNVDHVVKNHRLGLRTLYDDAWLSVCDSRILARLARIVGVEFPDVITGSDLTRRLIERYVVNGDRISVIGCDSANVERLRALLPGVTIYHYNPPMGFIHDESEIERAVAFVVAHPSRFVFFAVGAPQQEKLAARVRERGASGIGLCVGASILFVLGVEVRAPRWIQALHLEWLFRLLQSPRRLWRRYLIDDPLIFGLILRQRFAGNRLSDKRGSA